MTCVMDRAKDKALNTFFTGVLPDARGAGPPRRSRRSTRWPCGRAATTGMYTQNMDQNAPILAANDRLGFTVVPGYYAVGRPVRGAADG